MEHLTNIWLAVGFLAQVVIGQLFAGHVIISSVSTTITLSFQVPIFHGSKVKTIPTTVHKSTLTISSLFEHTNSVLTIYCPRPDPCCYLAIMGLGFSSSSSFPLSCSLLLCLTSIPIGQLRRDKWERKLGRCKPNHFMFLLQISDFLLFGIWCWCGWTNGYWSIWTLKFSLFLFRLV